MPLMDDMRKRTRCLVLGAIFAAGAAAFAQSPQSPAVAEVRQAIADARKEIETYKAAGGAAATADHPAIKWDATLWAYRARYPGTDAAALASAEAVRLLGRAELWDRAHARVESVAFDDPAWERLAAPIYEEGIARKDLPYTITTLSRAAASTTNASIKSAVLVVLGRAYRRHGDNAAATRSLEAARAASPGTPHAEEADGLLYEIKYLSIGLRAPAISGKTRNAGTIDAAALRGKPVVLVFWGST
jgi:hypothetical protein